MENYRNRIAKIVLVVAMLVPIPLGWMWGTWIAKARAAKFRMSEQVAKQDATRQAILAMLSWLDRDEDKLIIMPMTVPYGYCSPVVDSIWAEYQGAEGVDWDGIDVYLDWMCDVGNSTGCDICTVAVVYKSGEPYPTGRPGSNVYHVDDGRDCGIAASETEMISFFANFPEGNYTASIRVFASNFDKLTTSTPLLATTSLSWEITD